MNLKLFQNPSANYRPVPFWSWNDRLEDGELRRQIALMQAGGWGGFFMHARVGLETPYLTPEWFDRVRTAVDEAKKRGMRAWLYDEDKWPSGFAGGLSVAPNPDYRMKVLVCKPDNKPALMQERLRAFLARQVDGQLTDFRPVRSEDDLTNVQWGEEWLVQFYPHTVPLGVEWFNDYTYLDMLNPEAVRAFIRTTHEAYARAVGEEFGQTIPGIFTDEPCFIFQVGNIAGGPIRLPWTDGFPEYFARQNGYDLLDHLPALVYDTPESPAIRYDYWRTVTRRFLESWGKQMYDWCEAHNLAFTGHYMAENTLLEQVSWIGAAMPYYEYMHIPGIDKLERHIDQPITAKQVDSVACQLGRKRVLCEAYGCAGQDFNFPQRKWIGDHLYVLGVNLLTPHLSLYSMRGARKRDYPANIFYQQPWWPENRLLDDYFARLSYALSQGQRVVDVLVLHPIASAWTVYSPGAVHRVRELDRRLRGLNDDLLALHRDYHFGDEMLMEKYAAVASEGGDVFLRIGEMRYRVVVIPPGTTLARHTVELLNRFVAAGGSVIAIEPTPTLVDGRPAAAVLPAATTVIPPERQALRTALDQALPSDVAIADAPGVLYHHRRLEDGDLFFLA
ncbi:MAG: glycoside hydrolase, partial [Chloroflexi bacterium HGW-Chloroflexi-1]